VRLVGRGHFVKDAHGNQVLDANGNSVYSLDPGAKDPTLYVSRRGYYRAAYVQDTWKITPKFTANYGLRFDTYHQGENTGQPDVTKSQLSPRVNLAYEVLKGMVVRASYNKLFIQPPLAQGAILGEPIKPETLDQ